MRHFILALAGLALLAPEQTRATALVQKYIMTKPKPPSDCSAERASSLPAYTTLPATDREAYLWFFVTNANTGDVFRSDYYTP